MDPLSVAASIITVAGALYAVTKTLIKFAKSLAHAAKEVNYIAKEMTGFSTILRALRNILQQVPPEILQGLNLTQTCHDLVRQAKDNVREFNKFLTGLEPLLDSANATLVSRTKARLKWSNQKTVLAMLRAKLDSSKLTLILCVTMIHLRVALGELAAPKKKSKEKKPEEDDEKDNDGMDDLPDQVQSLTSQLGDERSNLKDAISLSSKLEDRVNGNGKRSLNQLVAKEALKLAKLQQAYALQQYEISMGHSVVRDVAVGMGRSTSGFTKQVGGNAFDVGGRSHYRHTFSRGHF